MSIYDEETRTWAGPKRTLPYNEEMNVGHLLMQVLEKTPEKVTQINADSGNRITCDEMRRKSIRVANALTQMGFKTGDIVMMAARNGPDIGPTLFGCLIIGAPFNAVDVNFSKDDIAHMINLLKPRLIFCDFDVLDKIYDALEEVDHRAHFVTFNDFSNKALFIDQLYKVYCDEDNYRFPDTGDSKKLPGVIMCSSGTTGLPKGVCLSHSQIIYQIFAQLPMTPQEVLIQNPSLYWISGLLTVLLTTFYSATRVTSTDPFTAKNFIDMVEKYEVTHIFGAPITFSLMLKHPDVFLADFSKVKGIYIGGSLVPPILKKTLMRVCKKKVCIIYGMTETLATCTSEVTGNEPDGSVGRVGYNMKARVVDKEGNCLEPNEIGELHFYCKYQFLSYYQNEEATRQTLTADGWIKTGDLGYFDSDGYLHLIGRERDTIKYMGNQISPAEIEGIIQQLKGVIMCCVVGINLELYDLPAAAVVKHPSVSLTEEDIEQAVANKLSDFKRLRGGVYFVDGLPRTISGKIKTTIVREMLTHLYNQRSNVEE